MNTTLRKEQSLLAFSADTLSNLDTFLCSVECSTDREIVISVFSEISLPSSVLIPFSAAHSFSQFLVIISSSSDKNDKVGLFMKRKYLSGLKSA